MFTIMAVFTLVVIVDLFLIFPQEKRGDSIFPPYMAELFLCSKCQDIFQNKKIKANLFPDSSTPPTLGARQLLEGQGTSLFLLRLSWLFFIYLIAKSISFLQQKDESSKIFPTHNV